jgi:predicted PurR-regulated permease PerM
MKDRTQRAITIALGVGAAAFIAALFLLQAIANWSVLAALIGAIVAFILAAAGAWLIADSRGTQQLQLDAYAVETQQKMQEALAKLAALRAYIPQIHDQETAHLLGQVCDDVEKLFERIRTNNANSLLSSAVIMSGHLTSLQWVFDQYIDIQQNPRYFDNPAEKFQKGGEALRSFDQYVMNSIRLLETGQNAQFEVAIKQLEASQYSALT